MDERRRAAAESARGFMPPDEGLALHDAAIDAGRRVPGAPFLEIGSYCGKSGIYLGSAAAAVWPGEGERLHGVEDSPRRNKSPRNGDTHPCG